MRYTSRTMREQRATQLQSKYGMTLEDYEKMSLEQEGRCAICRQPEAEGRLLSVDHDHETDRVRGLLCMNCNTALGKFKDDPQLLVAAASYLMGWK